MSRPGEPLSIRLAALCRSRSPLLLGGQVWRPRRRLWRSSPCGAPPANVWREPAPEYLELTLRFGNESIVSAGEAPVGLGCPAGATSRRGPWRTVVNLLAANRLASVSGRPGGDRPTRPIRAVLQGARSDGRHRGNAGAPAATRRCARGACTPASSTARPRAHTRVPRAHARVGRGLLALPVLETGNFTDSPLLSRSHSDTAVATAQAERALGFPRRGS